MQSPRHISKSSQKVNKGSTKPLGFTTPHYFYMYNISICDFGAIQTPRAKIYIFTTGTPYKIGSRILVLATLWTGIFTVECACPEPFRPNSLIFRMRFRETDCFSSFFEKTSLCQVFWDQKG